MDYIKELFFQILIVLIFGLLSSYVIWKIRKRKTEDFGEFFNKYGEMLAYASFILIALTIVIVTTLLT